MEWKIGVAGVSPITAITGIENVDVSDIVFAHEEYTEKPDYIFTRLKMK